MLPPLSLLQRRWGGTEVLLPCSSPGKVAFPLALTLVRGCGHVSASRQPAQPELEKRHVLGSLGKGLAHCWLRIRLVT